MTNAFNTIEPAEVKPLLQKHILADGFKFTLDLAKSRGPYIHDSLNERDLLDLFSYFATGALGHNHPMLTEDEDFKKELMLAALANPSNSDFYTSQYANFLSTFEEIAMPPPFKYAFFISGGTLAVENAIKVAMDWKTKKCLKQNKKNSDCKVIHFKEAFHGRSGYTLSLTNTKPRFTDHFTQFNWPRFNNPKLFFPVTDAVIKDVEQKEKEVTGSIEDLLKKEGDAICAILIEPIQSEGGDNHFRKEFFKELRRLADEYEVMLVFDEVQNGVGLTGKFWAYQHFDVVPDVLAFGKKMQVCGIISTGRVDEVEENCFHQSGRLNSTWGGNLADMVRSTKILRIIDKTNLVENAAVTGDYLLEKILDLQSKRNISNGRGRGLQCAFDLPATEQREQLLKNALANNLLLLGAGKVSIRFRPFLDVKKEEIDEAFFILNRTLEQMGL